MSGTSFFRTSVCQEKDVEVAERDADDEQTAFVRKKRPKSFKERMSVNAIEKIQKLVTPITDTNLADSKSNNETEANTSNTEPPHSPVPPNCLDHDDNKPKEKRFTNTPLFEHFLVIGVPIDSAAEMADQINRKKETLSDKLKSQMGNLWKRGVSNSSLQEKPVVVESPKKPPPEKSTLSGRWGELSKSLKAAGNQGSGGGIFDMNIIHIPSSPSSRSSRSDSSSSVGPNKPQPAPPINIDPPDQQDVPVPIASVRNSNLSYTEPSILYRYPPDADPPPAEVCDFCLPAGGRLRHLVNPTDRDQSTLEMLYGYGQSQRSSRCFIFVLEDKTLDPTKNIPNEETGENTGRLFGICVVNPRLLNPYTPTNNPSGKYQKQPGVPDVEFEATVCYCFITRFPLFDFFFQVLWNIIAFERISRMIDVSEHPVGTSELDLYRYIPSNVYDYVMNQLTPIAPPRYNGEIKLHVDSSLHAVAATRIKPGGSHPEYFQRSAEWALPPLLHWLDAKTIVWALSLLLSEVKLVIIGKDAATVSCAVIGLTSLLKPFQWVSPMIPILPIKHLDFIESPVPIIAGIVLDNDSPNATSFRGSAISPLNVLRQCDDGDVTAVLDISGRDIFTLSGYKKNMGDFLLPGATTLVDHIESIMDSSGVKKLENNSTTHPPYEITKVHMGNFDRIQAHMHEFMKEIASTAKTTAKEVLDGQMAAVEEKVKAQLEQLSSLKELNQKRRTSLSANLFGTIEENKEEDDSESDEDGDENDTSTSLDSPSLGSGYTIPILSLKTMKFPASRRKQVAKFYERFVSTQIYSEYDMEFDAMLQNVEAAITGENDVEDNMTLSASRGKRLSGRRSGRKSILPSGPAKKSRSRSMYIMASDELKSLRKAAGIDNEMRAAQEVAAQGPSEKSSLKSKSALMQTVNRRLSRASSDV